MTYATHVPADFLDQLKPSLQPRWKFWLRSWRWRILKFYDDEKDRYCDLLTWWHGLDGKSSYQNE